MRTVGAGGYPSSVSKRTQQFVLRWCLHSTGESNRSGHTVPGTPSHPRLGSTGTLHQGTSKSLELPAQRGKRRDTERDTSATSFAEQIDDALSDIHASTLPCKQASMKRGPRAEADSLSSRKHQSIPVRSLGSFPEEDTMSPSGTKPDYPPAGGQLEGLARHDESHHRQKSSTAGFQGSDLATGVQTNTKQSVRFGQQTSSVTDPSRSPGAMLCHTERKRVLMKRN